MSWGLLFQKNNRGRRRKRGDKGRWGRKGGSSRGAKEKRGGKGGAREINRQEKEEEVPKQPTHSP